MTLYEIDSQIFDLFDPETGELLDYDAFEQLSMERDRKIENTALYVKNLRADVAAIAEEEKALAERRRRLQKRADGLCGYLSMSMAGAPYTSPKCDVAWRLSERTEISDKAAVMAWALSHGHAECVKEIEPEISLSAVKTLLKAGEAIPGAALTKMKNIQIK